jgi:hypothetical protein
VPATHDYLGNRRSDLAATGRADSHGVNGTPKADLTAFTRVPREIGLAVWAHFLLEMKTFRRPS